jgi:ABC-2 type transport system ATP-binding protein
VSIDVGRGEIFGFLGPNGASKTTTLRMLTTLLPIDAGSATVAGLDVVRQPGAGRSRIGYVSQLGGADEPAAITNGINLPVLLLAGVLLPMSLGPLWMRVIAHVNPLYYLVEA